MTESAQQVLHHLSVSKGLMKSMSEDYSSLEK